MKSKLSGLGFKLYLIFVVSWFLHLTARYPFLGTIRFDLLMILTITALIFFKKPQHCITKNHINIILGFLFFYAIITIPLVVWPGSALKYGLPNLLKVIVFYFFTIKLIDSQKRLKNFLWVFLLCQCFRVAEPVYLHLTTGYWGSFASMANWESMDRLAGSPYDTINPNGLAYVIVTALPFLYYLSFISKKTAIFGLCTMPVLLYALNLTASRSGMLGLLAIVMCIILKSKRKAKLIVLAIGLFTISWPALTPDQRDRYLSLVRSDTKNYESVQQRREGVAKNFAIAMQNPLFGHGLGTSREANANFGDADQPAHNLYAEIAQELGFIGLAIFLWFIFTLIRNSFETGRRLRVMKEKKGYLFYLNNGLQVWLIVNILFSFASYGLLSFEWYLLAGLSEVVRELVSEQEYPDAR